MADPQFMEYEVLSPSTHGSLGVTSVPLAPGWQTDPDDPTTVHYWDGTSYTAQMRWDGAQWVEPVPVEWQVPDGFSHGSETGSAVADSREITDSRPAEVETHGTPSAVTSDKWAGLSSNGSTRGRRRASLRWRWPILIVVIVLAGGSAGVVVSALVHGSGNGVANDSPGQIMALATSAAQRAGSVHVVTAIQIQGNTATYLNDAAARSGIQTIVAGGARVTAIVVGATVYVDANALAMTEMFGQSVASSQQFAGKWLSFPSGSEAYGQIAQTLTLGSLLRQVVPTGRVTKLGPTVVNGRSVIGIHGELASGLSGTLYVAATGSPLPVEEVSGPAGGETTSTFSGWGEVVTARPPRGAIPGSQTGLF